jgi:hypothetical protein
MLSSQVNTSVLNNRSRARAGGEAIRVVLLYLGLVGLPVLGILGLLQVGQTLSAPISLAGTWNAQLNPDSKSTAADPGLLPQPMVLTITQSGPDVILVFDDNQRTTLVGKIQGATIDATALGHDGTTADSAADFGNAPRSFRASIDWQAEPRRLVGMLVLDRGRLHAEVPIVAVRKREVHKGGGS